MLSFSSMDTEEDELSIVGLDMLCGDVTHITARYECLARHDYKSQSSLLLYIPVAFV